MMNCDDIRSHWSLYHDSEGDPELHWQVSEHLAGCASCAEWFDKQSRLESLLHEKMAGGTTDDAMWNRILTAAGVVEPVQSAARRRWFMFSALAACAAAVMIAVGAWTLLSPGQGDNDPSLSTMTAVWHDNLVNGNETAAFRSESDLAVENFLRSEVRFPVRCPPRKDSGFAVRGAGTCRLAEQPAAFVFGHVDQSPVSIFILSKDSLAAFPRQREELSLETVHRCREGSYEMALSVIDGNLVVVVGRVATEKLQRVLNAYGTYPHSPA